MTARGQTHQQHLIKPVGVRPVRAGLVQMVTRTDPEMFDVIQKRAAKAKISMAEEIRTLLSIGLEEADD